MNSISTIRLVLIARCHKTDLFPEAEDVLIFESVFKCKTHTEFVLVMRRGQTTFAKLILALDKFYVLSHCSMFTNHVSISLRDANRAAAYLLRYPVQLDCQGKGVVL